MLKLIKEGTITKSEFQVKQLCPECGKDLLTNFRYVWCSNIGRMTGGALCRRGGCGFGIVSTMFYDFDNYTVLQSQ